MPGKRKSEKLKELEGTQRSDRTPEIRPGSGFPECPRKLFVGKDGKPDKVAQDCWRRLKREFDIESDMISGLDFHALFLFCEAWSRFCADFRLTNITKCCGQFYANFLSQQVTAFSSIYVPKKSCK